MDDEDAYDYLDDAFYGDSGNGSGSYGVDTGVSDSGSVVNAQGPVTTAAADASGGNGSFLGVLQNTLTSGLSDAALEGEEYGLGSLTGLLTGNTEGYAVPAAAPTGTSVSIGPWTVAVIAVTLVGIVWLIARK